MQNDNNNPFDLPRINDNQQNKENESKVQPKKGEDLDLPKPVETLEELAHVKEETKKEDKPLIEIPQEYYDKVAAEEKAKKEAEEKAIQDKIETRKNSQESSKLISEIFVDIIIFFGLLFVTAKIFKYAVIGIPIYIIIATIVGTVSSKKESNAPTAIVASGVAIAVVTFLISAINSKNMDFWTYFAILGAVIGIVGGLLSKIITTIITDSKNIKGLQALGMIFFFVLIIGGPIFAYKKFPEKFYQYLFYDKTVIVAENEEDYLIKTLAVRYGSKINCDRETIKYHINEHNQRITEMTCSDNNKNEFSAKAIAYNEGNKEYTVTDDYINVALLKPIKDQISKELSEEIIAKSVTVLLYPKENCTFVGDCAPCDEYFKRVKVENNIDNQYNASKQLDMKKYVSYKPQDFVNEYGFKFVFTVIGTYNEAHDFNGDVNSVLKYLNSNGYKNEFGYVITFMNKNESSETMNEIYKVTGNTNNEKSFKEPKVVNGNNNNNK